MKMVLIVLALIAGTPALAQTGATTPPPVPDPHPLTELRVIVFAGGFNLPLWAAIRQGYMAEEGLNPRLTFTPNSVYQITQLLAGNYDIAMTALDNVVAYQEGQNEAPIGPNPDLFAFMGSDDAFLSLVSQAPFKTIGALRGHVVTVDAMTTGYAFVLREILTRSGIGPGDVTFERQGGVADRFRAMLAHPEQAATIQMTPFELLGESRGMNTLVRADDVFGHYAGICAVSRRSWAEAHRPQVMGYIRAYKRAVDWLYDPANRAIAEAILVANVASMTPDLAHRSYDVLLNPTHGFYRDVAVDIEGVRTVLALRSKYGEPHKELTDPMRYIDLSYREKALTKP
jgi:ABC-type nitrate/sulfonate/bicarbonate transport system substrate-binding protein